MVPTQPVATRVSVLANCRATRFDRWKRAARGTGNQDLRPYGAPGSCCRRIARANAEAMRRSVIQDSAPARCAGKQTPAAIGDYCSSGSHIRYGLRFILVLSRFWRLRPIGGCRGIGGFESSEPLNVRKNLGTLSKVHAWQQCETKRSAMAFPKAFFSPPQIATIIKLPTESVKTIGI